MWFYVLLMLVEVIGAQHGEYIIGVDHKIGMLLQLAIILFV